MSETVRHGKNMPQNLSFPVGRFWVESSNATSSAAASFSWSCEHGTMSPSEGSESFLSLTSIPQGDDKTVWVTVEIALDERTKPKRAYWVPPCLRRDFKVESTENFSPHLGESMGVTVTIPGCAHTREASWAEVEIMRETIGGFDHVAWVDMDSTTSGTGRCHEIQTMERTAWGAWDGIAQAGLGLADHHDVFTGPKGSFNRAMPAVKSGDPVPPPFYAVVARLLDADKTAILNAITNTVFVPQVVRVGLVQGVLEDFLAPLDYFDGTNTVRLYSGANIDPFTAGILLRHLGQNIASFFPDDMNIRFAAYGQAVRGDFITVSLHGGTHGDGHLALSKLDRRNAQASGQCDIYLGGLRGELERYFHERNAGKDFFTLPLGYASFLIYIAFSATHEIGHAIGLVDSNIMFEDAENPAHNPESSDAFVMDAYGLKMQYILMPSKYTCWLSINHKYMRFILPTKTDQTENNP